MPRQIRHSLIRCRADEYGAAWYTMNDGVEVLAYSAAAAREAWEEDQRERTGERHRQQAEQAREPELL